MNAQRELLFGAGIQALFSFLVLRRTAAPGASPSKQEWDVSILCPFYWKEKFIAHGVEVTEPLGLASVVRGLQLAQ